MTNHDKKFIFLDHPVNLKIQAFGKDLEELFSNSALGMMTFLYPKNIAFKEHEVKAKIKLKASNSKELLGDWLSEILYLSDSRDCCYDDFDIDKLDEDELVADIFGRRVKAKEDIKTVRSRDLEIEQTEDGWQATILFDI